MTEAASVSSDLCTACGICCSGPIFDYVPVEADERERLIANSFTLEPDGEGWKFKLPCTALCGTVCSAYAVRPRVCREYSCRVLTRLEEGELGFDEATELVAEARSAIERVAACLRPDENLASGRKRWRAMADDWRADPRFHVHMTALNLFLDREFREEDQILLPGPDSRPLPAVGKD